MKLKQAVPENQLYTFCFSEKQINQLSWYEAHEFEFQNKMYDIVYSKKLENGFRIFQCVSDEQETKLFAQLNSVLDKEVNEKQKIPLGNLKVIINHPQFLSEFPSISAYCIETLTNELNTSYLFNLQTGYLIHIAEPPDFIYS